MAERTIRADAQRNRERLLQVAATAFAADGPEVTFEAIAKEAGVGIGTLYRHFPTREALVEEVYRAEITALDDSAGQLLATLAPEAALSEWMRRFVAFMTTKRGMAEVLRAIIASGGNPYEESRSRALAAVSTLLAAAAASGAVRDDANALDVLTTLNGFSLAVLEPAQTDRLIDLLMDGLRAGGSRPLS